MKLKKYGMIISKFTFHKFIMKTLQVILCLWSLSNRMKQPFRNVNNQFKIKNNQ